MNIGMVGLGFVGLTLAIALAEGGAKVYGTEVNENIKKSLKKNKAHFFEPGLDDLIIKHNNKNFYVSDNFSKSVKFDAFIITVGTPLIKNSTMPNFDYIKEAIKTIAQVYDGSQVVILRSTVSVGTTRNIVLPLLKELTNLEDNKLFVAMCPERTVEGKAIEELRELPQIISGNNEMAKEKAKNVFSHTTDKIIFAQSLEEAELAKLYCNTYRDITFNLGNAFTMAAQQFGVDGISVINLANKDYSRANMAKPGFVAGPCLEKDAYLLTNNMEESVYKDFILSGRKINDAIEEATVKWVKDKVGEKTSKFIALSGMAFKGRPETSDLRGSPSLRIAEKLKEEGYNLILHDFIASQKEMESLNLGRVSNDFNEIIREDVAALLVLNDHKRYEEIEINGINLKVFDACSVCHKLKNKSNIELYSFGNMFV